MTSSPLIQPFESGDALPFKVLRFLILAGGTLLLCFAGILELTWPQQIVLGLLTVALVIWLDRSSSSYLITLTLLLVSVFSTFRYGYWRYATTSKYLFAPGGMWSKVDVFFIALLLFAETYAFLTLFLGYLQTLWPLRRTPVALPDDIEAWPAVDLLIPTLNEPLSLVKFTALAALNIDWPAGKLNVYILDDGKREEFRKFAEDAGIGYMTRDTNEHAKAGNINNALAHLNSPYVAIFDCDHVPTRSFLQITLGWFLRDSKLGMLQTPHHFYSPDPFERNLDQFRMIPNEGDFFYSVVQDGNDFWNSTFFCGSCAVLRRSALDEIGGVAVETVTEDAHTSLRMQMGGWNTAYINIPQAAGLATERLSGHIRQRIRWARGMIQILRTDNPLFARGLNLAQRLCYFNSMTHFLYALPRLIFLTAPLIYLIFGRVNLPGYWIAILAYAFPHLVLASVANSRIQGHHRHTYWNEIYETVLAPYILLPTVLALLSPKLGSFDVTAKGGVVNRRFFDRRIASPYLFLIAINLLGILCAIPRLVQFPRFVQFPGAAHGFPLNLFAGMYDGHHVGTIVMNLVWAVFNLIVLGVATSVAWESRQRRQAIRIAIKVPADVQLSNGVIVRGLTGDISTTGMMLRMQQEFVARVGEAVKITLPVLSGNATLPATLVGIGASGNILRVQFDPLTLHEEEALAIVLYSRADTWLGWSESRQAGKPGSSLGKIFKLSFNGIRQTLRDENKPRTGLATSILPLLLITVLSSISTSQVISSPTGQPSAPLSGQTLKAIPANPPATDTFDNTVTFADLGVTNTIVLHGADASRTIRFSLPQTQVVKTATMHLRYRFSPALLPSISHLKISLNGTVLNTLPVAPPPVAETAPTEANAIHKESSSIQETTLTLPVEALAPTNELTFDFVGHSSAKCEDPSNSALWTHIDATSTIEFAGSLVALADNLKSLPAPFYDSRIDLHPSIPIVFLTQPSPKALQAAGIVASWLGILARSRTVRFPVSIATIPKGNAIVIAEDSASLPAPLRLPATSNPTIAIRANPSDPYAKVLILTGNSADDVLTAAIALSLPPNLFDGPTVTIPSLKSPAPRAPDDAPRWLSTETATPFGDIQDAGNLDTDGRSPIAIYPRLPPDLDYGTRQNLNLHLAYRYNNIPLAGGSALQIKVNGSYVDSTPLPHTGKTSAQPETVIPIPVSAIRPFSNTLQMRFLFKLPKKDDCQNSNLDPSFDNNLNGSILKNSYLDIQGIPHWATLPNLEIFANAGYPFTRRADLSDTAVVLPDVPTAEEIELYLTLMGHFGAQTGYPVLNVSVTNADGMTPGRTKDGRTKDDRTKDYLVLGTVDDQPAISRLNPSLPVGVDGSGLHIQDTQGFFSPLQHAWWKVRSSERIQPGQLETDGGLPDALIEGIEWPARSRRSAVVIILSDQDIVPSFLSTFLRTSQSSDISQSVSVLHGSRFSSYRIGDRVYHVGSLSPWFRLKMFFADNEWLMVLAILCLCLLMAAILRALLRRMARLRLQGNG